MQAPPMSFFAGAAQDYMTQQQQNMQAQVGLPKAAQNPKLLGVG